MYIKNTDSANHIYVVFDAVPQLQPTDDAVKISPNESFLVDYPNTTVAGHTRDWS